MAMLVSTRWHREEIKSSTVEILVASMHINVNIILYHVHHKTVLLWTGHLSRPAWKQNGVTWPAPSLTVTPTAASILSSAEV